MAYHFLLLAFSIVSKLKEKEMKKSYLVGPRPQTFSEMISLSLAQPKSYFQLVNKKG